MKRLLRLGAAVVAALVAVPLIATPAHASAYRYWSYWSWSNGAWQYSTKGPGAGVPHGDTIGWRFAVQADSSSAHAPRASGTSLCSDGVTVVIDYGTASDEPPNEHPPSSTPRAFCADDPDSTTGYRATAEHATVRVRDDGLVCGIDGYPKTECAPVVSSSTAPTSQPTTATAPGTKARGVHTHAAAPLPTPRITQTAQPGAAATKTPSGVIAQGSSGVVPSPTPTVLLSNSKPGGSKSGGSSLPIALMVGIGIAAALGGVAFWRYRASPR